LVIEQVLEMPNRKVVESNTYSSRYGRIWVRNLLVLPTKLDYRIVVEKNVGRVEE